MTVLLRFIFGKNRRWVDSGRREGKRDGDVHDVIDKILSSILTSCERQEDPFRLQTEQFGSFGGQGGRLG